MIQDKTIDTSTSHANTRTGWLMLIYPFGLCTIALSMALFLFAYSHSRAWQILAAAGFLVLSISCLSIANRLIALNKSESIIIGFIFAALFAYSGSELFLSGMTPYVIGIGILLLFLAGNLLLPQKWVGWLTSCCLFITYIVLVKWHEPFHRFDVTQSNALSNYILPVGAFTVAAISVWQFVIIFRQVKVIRRQLLVAFIFVVLITCIFISSLSVIVELRTAKQRIISQLESVTTLKTSEIDTWVSRLKINLAFLSEEYQTFLTQIFLQAPQSLSHQESYRELKNRFTQNLRQLKMFEEIFLINSKGKVIMSTHLMQEGKTLINPIFPLEGLNEVRVHPPFYSLSLDRMSVVATHPIVNHRGDITGVLAGRASLAILQEIMLERAGLGNTGETYLVGSNRVLLTGSRYINQEKAARTYLRNKGVDATVKNHINGSGLYKDYRGVPVIGVYRWLSELQVALLAEQDQFEAFRSSYITLGVNSVVALVAVLSAIVAALFITRSITRPLSNLAETAEMIEGGNLDLVAKIEREDEIGKLANAFNQMTARLKHLISKLEHQVVELKEAEEALETSHETFLTVLNSIDATIYVADMETYKILFMNKYMRESFGKDFTGDICWEAFRGESQPCQNCTNDQLRDENGKPTGVCVWQNKNPITKKWYINYDRAIEWTDGRLVRLQIATDITNLKKAEEDTKKLESQLLRAEKLESIGTLAGGIAHDFNNLLMGIQGRTSLALIDTDSSHPHLEHLKGIEDYVRSATDLTKQLLGFARGGKYEVKSTNINDLLRKSSEMFGRTKKEVVIHPKYQEDLWSAEVDRGQIEQILMNLYVNAWQSMPGGGDLYLESENVFLDEEFLSHYDLESGKYIRISVTDTGIGMDKTTQKKIFDPFFTTKEMGRGTGLGLASVYGIVKSHGGIIDVKSDKGSGATFNIYLPASEKAVQVEKKSNSDIVKGSETILLVDDEEMVIDVGGKMLERMGYRVLTAKSGKEAIEIYQMKNNRIDLIILDMIMPLMGGGETYDRFKKMDPDIKVLLSSGYSIDGQAREILDRGCNGFIPKPFDLIELSKKLREILDV